MSSVSVKLTQGIFASVSEEDLELVSQYSWVPMRNKFKVYAIHCRREYQGRKVRRKAVTLLMHRLIMGLKPGDRRVVDHIDGDGLNNVRSNLRVCTQAQNLANSTKHKKATSTYKGVALVHGKWRASIKRDGKLLILGKFDDEIQAALAYDAAARSIRGEYAKTNFGDSAAEYGIYVK